MKFAVAAIASLVLLGSAASASGATGPLNSSGMTVSEAAAWLKGLGYAATVEKESDGTQYIASEADGIKFDVYFYDCEQSRCRALQFSAGFDLTSGLTPAKVNEWNRDQRYMKAYLDDTNDPTVQYDANVAPGGTYEALDDDFSVFISGLGDFAGFIGF